MALRPKHVCPAPGCTATTRERYCERHAQTRGKDYDAEHKAERSFYWSTRWRKFRAWFLAGHPLCEWCLEHGHVTAATQVDHRKPRRDYPSLAFDEANCRAGCASCHAKYGEKAS